VEPPARYDEIADDLGRRGSELFDPTDGRPLRESGVVPPPHAGRRDDLAAAALSR
jgi:hypothetical protein